MERAPSEAPMTTQATVLWACGLAIGGAVAFLGAFGVLSVLGSWGLIASDSAAMRWDLAILLGVMGALGVAGVLAAGRLAFGTWPRPTVGQLLLPAAGVAIAMAVELALHEWARVHIGMYEFDHVMPTAILPWVTILAGLSAFAALIAPPGAAVPPLLGSWLAAGAAILITLSNAPGVMDGIELESWPLAILIGIAMAYAVGVAVAATQRAAKRRSQHR